MSPGLPVIGLGALFCVLSALAAPAVEIVRAARGQTRVASWLQVGRQFALAVVMIAAFYVTLQVVYTLVAGARFSELSPGGGLALSSALVVTSVAVLAALLAAAKAMELVVGALSTHPLLAIREMAFPRRLLLQGAGVLAAAWFPLLAFGVAGLSPHSDGLVSRSAVPAPKRSDNAVVAGAVSARKRGVNSSGDDPKRETNAARTANGNDASLPASPSGGEGSGTVGSPSSPGGELIAPAPDYDASGGEGTGGNGQGPSTGGLAVSGDTGGSGRVPSTGGTAAPSE